MNDTVRKVWLALAMATAAFNLLAGAAVAAGATGDTGIGQAALAAVMLVGGAVMALGLAIRDRGRIGNTLIALGAIPALLWFWYLVPALLRDRRDRRSRRRKPPSFRDRPPRSAERRRSVRRGFTRQAEDPLTDDVALDLGRAAPDRLGAAEEERRLQRATPGSRSRARGAR